MTLILPRLKTLWSPNYSSRNGQRVRLIAIHDCEGSYAGSVGWFAMARSQVSAQGVLSDDGSEMTQMVAFANKAWHACAFNGFSEGYEAAGYAAKGLGAPEWQALANVVAFRLRANGIPCQIATPANNWTGYCQHVDLGQAGGGHHDITLDPALRAEFFAQVQAGYAEDMPARWGDATPAVVPALPPGFVPSPVPRHDLKPGSLEWVQAELNKLGYAVPPLKVDGMIGSETEAAVEDFQRAKKLGVDGDPGPLTIAALEAA